MSPGLDQTPNEPDNPLGKKAEGLRSYSRTWPPPPAPRGAWAPNARAPPPILHGWDHTVMFLGLGQVGTPHLLYPQHRTAEEPGEETNGKVFIKWKCSPAGNKVTFFNSQINPGLSHRRASHAPAEILIPSPTPRAVRWKQRPGGDSPGHHRRFKFP